MRKRNCIGLAALTALLLAFAPPEAEAQFELGQKYIGAHIGLSGVGSAAALGLHGEFAYNENIGIGATFDTWSYSERYTGIFQAGWTIRYLAFAGTGAWHFPVESNPKLDPFVGLGVGYFVVDSKWDGGGVIGSYSGSGSRVFADGFAGLRYHFQPTLSGVLRAGVSVSYLTAGMDFRF
jgi:hypothetical protein